MMNSRNCDYEEDMEMSGKENMESNITEDVETLLSTSKEDGIRICDYAVDSLIEQANVQIDKRTADWEILNHVTDVPTLSMAEIEIGRLLGEGGFFEVYEIQNIALDDNGDGRKTPEMAKLKTDDVGVVQDRRYMQENCRRPSRNGQIDCRYAIKVMKKHSLSDPELFVNTLVDFAIERRLLTSLKHPNIIKLRGIGTGTGLDSFIVLDRLYQTLTEQIARWKDKKENSFGFVFDFRGKKQKAFLAERLAVGFDIASALEYLHDRNIIYRDLKPDNLGFDVRGDIKLFDFGLATEFDKEKHGSFKLTGDTGTIRYMAPEVAMEQSYSEKADVYSFGILLWQLLSLEAPYGNLHGGKIEYSVCHLGLRPKLDASWPPSMLKLLEDCFARDAPRRPPMETICAVLQREANSLVDKKLRDEEWIDASKTAQSERYFEIK